MTVILDDADLLPHPTRRDAVVRAWTQLVGPGPVLSADERRAVIGWARAAWAGATAPDEQGGPAAEAAHWLAADAGGITAEVVDDLEARGLDRLRYLEIVGIVGRLANIDFYARGLGASLPAVPDEAHPSPEPTGQVAPERERRGFVPSIAALRAPFVLDALPGEGEELRAMHEPMYLPMTAIGDFTFGDVLTRPQIEYLASRASYLNECFY
ncbi:MAG: hypothetical protein AAF962_09190 [Actinomycetota bacterium]